MDDCHRGGFDMRGLARFFGCFFCGDAQGLNMTLLFISRRKVVGCGEALPLHRFKGLHSMVSGDSLAYKAIKMQTETMSNALNINTQKTTMAAAATLAITAMTTSF